MTLTWILMPILAAACIGLVVAVHALDRRDDRRYGRLVDRQPLSKRGPNRRRL